MNSFCNKRLKFRAIKVISKQFIPIVKMSRITPMIIHEKLLLTILLKKQLSGLVLKTIIKEMASFLSD